MVSSGTQATRRMNQAIQERKHLVEEDYTKHNSYTFLYLVDLFFFCPYLVVSTLKQKFSIISIIIEWSFMRIIVLFTSHISLIYFDYSVSLAISKLLLCFKEIYTLNRTFGTCSCVVFITQHLKNCYFAHFC